LTPDEVVVPEYFTGVFSLTIYATLIFGIWKRREIFSLRGWPKDPTLFRVWTGWIIFLVLLAPLSYFAGDMDGWVNSIISLLHGRPLPDNYVYLPAYAELLAALACPFTIAGVQSTLLLIYVVKLPVITSYVYCAKLMSEILPGRSELAPLGIVLAPVTIFYLFFGTNHVVMFFFLLAALVLLKKGNWFWSGFFAFSSCYKFLLVPTLLVFIVLLLMRHEFKKVIVFCLGGVLFLVPSFIYYCYEPALLMKVISNQAALGGHCFHIEPMHFLFSIKNSFPGLENMYVGQKLWFYLSLSGVPLSILLYWRKRLNFCQSLAFSCAIVAIFALEPFRLEPMIGLLWLDSVHRDDLRAQTGIIAILLIQAAAWYDLANSWILTFYSTDVLYLWNFRGLLLGLAIIVTLLIILLEKDKRDFVFEEG
jgi:hypothetical protein